MASDIQETYRLRAAIGFCIMNWAHVETELNMMFHAVHDGDPEAADVMWSSFRSFEQKLQVLNRLFSRSDLSKKIKDDFRILCDYVPSQYRLRNMVAHSTPIDMKQPDGTANQCVLPFMALFGPMNKPINADQINGYGESFYELRNALSSINPGIKKLGKRRPQLKEPDHDLIGRLRKEDGRKREVQRHRALAWRQYLRDHPDLK